MKRNLLTGILVCCLALSLSAPRVSAGEAPMTRAEAAHMLDGVMAYADMADITGLRDLDPGAPYTPAILRLNAAGVMLGWEGRLRPDDAITREELAVLIARAFDLRPDDAGAAAALAGYSDHAQISEWAHDAAAALTQMGCMDGGPHGRFRPGETLTGAEARAVLDCALQASPGLEAQLAACLSGEAPAVTRRAIELMYRYYRDHVYELAMLPPFADGQPPSWDALTRYIHLNAFWHNRPLSAEDYSMTRDRFAREVERYFGDMEYVDQSSAYLTYENGLYTPVPGDSMRTGHYRLWALDVDSQGVFTASFDVLVFSEFEPYEAYAHASQNIRAIRDSAGVTQPMEDDAFQAAILSIFYQEDYGRMLTLSERVTLRFTLSGDEAFPLRYLSCRIEAAGRPYSGFALPPHIDFDDLEAVNAAFVAPLYYLGQTWFYSWDAPGEIEAEDLLLMLGMENYLGLPRNVAGRYLDTRAPAELVEAALAERFGVSADYLRTSELYHGEDNTYTLIGEGGGGWNATAMSTRREGRYVYIEIGIASMGELGEVCTPQGLLTVELGEGSMWFCSYALYD